jgi:hypothetical protein
VPVVAERRGDVAGLGDGLLEEDGDRLVPLAAARARQRRVRDLADQLVLEGELRMLAPSREIGSAGSGRAPRARRASRRCAPSAPARRPCRRRLRRAARPLRPRQRVDARGDDVADARRQLAGLGTPSASDATSSSRNSGLPSAVSASSAMRCACAPRARRGGAPARRVVVGRERLELQRACSAAGRRPTPGASDRSSGRACVSSSSGTSRTRERASRGGSSYALRSEVDVLEDPRASAARRPAST